ncbi:MAG: ribose-phosphate diphosphokinase [Chloroflexi bacterium]|nr:ribose-phosphate diphosphokinase [Chloroflexota bacterium]
MVYRDLSIFSGTAHPELAKAVCRYLGVPLGKAEVVKFSNENIFPKINQNVREHDVFIQPRVPITARLIADMLQTAGANRMLTIDLHAGQVQGFFNIPVDELTAMQPLLRDYVVGMELIDPVVVAGDLGFAKRARNFADMIGASVAFVEKRRMGNNSSSESLGVIGDVRGKSAIIIDDEILTGGSIVGAAEIVEKAGARVVYAACTHALLTGPAIERLRSSPIKELIATDTVAQSVRERLPNMTVLSVSLLLGEAISRIHTGESIGAMFGAPV